MKEGSKLFKDLMRWLKESNGMVNEQMLANHLKCSVNTAKRFLKEYAIAIPQEEIEPGLVFYYPKP